MDVHNLGINALQNLVEVVALRKIWRLLPLLSRGPLIGNYVVFAQPGSHDVQASVGGIPFTIDDKGLVLIALG
jgi:hypothetical protein